MPVRPGDLAVVKKTGLYKDLDSGERDMLYAREVVRVLRKERSLWVVDPGPGANTMAVPDSALTAFKDPSAAEGRYKPGGFWRGR